MKHNMDDTFTVHRPKIKSRDIILILVIVITVTVVIVISDQLSDKRAMQYN